MTDLHLTSDPVFQLNTMLWALQDISDAGEIRPVLRRAGYFLRAIGRGIIVPVDPSVLEALRIVTGNADRSSPRPDLWLGSKTDDVELVLELKAHGFARDSSNASQATKLMVSAADLGPSLGIADPRPGHLMYVVPIEDSDSMANTLHQLTAELTMKIKSVAASAVIGIVEIGEGIALASPHPDELPGPARVALATPAIVFQRTDPEASLQPLYFVPWIPGIDESQDARLRSDGLRELTARVLTHAIKKIGRTRVPNMAVLTGSALLQDATFEIFQYWQDNDRQLFADAVAKILHRALGSTTGVRRMHDRLEIDLPNDDAQEDAIDKLEKADPADPSKSLETAINEPPTLWD